MSKNYSKMLLIMNHLSQYIYRVCDKSFVIERCDGDISEAIDNELDINDLDCWVEVTDSETQASIYVTK